MYVPRAGFRVARTEQVKRIKWQLSIEDRVSGCPAIAEDGTIIIASESGTIIALNPNGTWRWTTHIDELVGNLRFFGFGASPVIGEDNTLYIASNSRYPDHYSKLYAFSIDGVKKWEYLVSNYGIGSTPAIGNDGVIYFGTVYQVYGYPATSLHALFPNGEKKWEKSFGSMSLEKFMDIGCVVIAKEGGISVGSYAVGHLDPIGVAFCTSRLHQLSADGSLLGINTGVDSPIVSLGDSGKIFTVNHDGFLMALNQYGEEIWVSDTRVSRIESEFKLPFAVTSKDGTIYCGSEDQSLIAFNPDGKKKWEYPLRGLAQTSPALGEDGTIFVTTDTEVYAIDTSGSLKWALTLVDDDENTEYHNIGHPAIGQDGNLYVIAEKMHYNSSTGYSTWSAELYAIQTDCGGLMNSVWPKYRQNGQNTGLGK